MPTSSTVRARSALVVALVTLTALVAPAPVAADHGGIHVEARAVPEFVPFEPAGAWVRGAFHVTHGNFGMYSHSVYDPVDDAWAELPIAPHTRPGASAASLGGLLYVVGGVATSETPGCVSTLRGDVCPFVETYDPVTREWGRVADMPTARADAGVAVLDGRLYVVGGLGSEVAARAVERYDPATDQWTVLPPLLDSRIEASSLTALLGRLYLVGGKSETGAPTSTTYVYHPLLALWTRAADAPMPVYKAVGGTCAGKLLLFGGIEFDGEFGSRALVVRQYDPVLDAWSVAADLRTWPMPARGSLTMGDLTMSVGAFDAHAIRCPVGIGPWETDADLVADDVVLDPATPAMGDVVRLSAVVRNRGAAAAPAASLEFRIGRETLGSAAVPALDPGASVTVQGPEWTAGGGDHALETWVDVADAAAEWNEDNNVRVETVHVRQPDLTVESLTLHPADAGPGESAKLAAVVRNVGDMDAIATRTNFVVTAVSFFRSSDTPPVAAGEAVTVLSASFTVPSGSFSATARADWGNAIDETDDLSNNARTVTLEGALADLVPRDLSATPALPRDGDATTFTVAIENLGEHAAAPFTVRFVLGGETFDDVAVGELAAGASVNVTSAAWTAVEGNHTLSAIADAIGVVEESDESNNATSATVEVGPPRVADLVVDDVLVSPAQPTPGNRVSTSAVVRNAGDAASAASTVRFTRDGESLGDATLPALAPGASATVNAPSTWLATPGTYELVAAADPEDDVAESDEANNSASRSVAV